MPSKKQLRKMKLDYMMLRHSKGSSDQSSPVMADHIMLHNTNKNSVNSTAVTSAVHSAEPSRYPSRAPSPGTKTVFRFFDLPSELRLRTYEHVLCTSKPMDLDPMNYRQILPRLSIFLVSRRMHEEAYRVFYSQVVRLFPMHGRFFHTKKPLLARLPARYRNEITTVELRLGPGWTQPPRSQNTNFSLGLADCTSLRTLKVVVEIDTSDSVFAGFRGKGATEETYKCFCIKLLDGIIKQVPSLEVVELDRFPAVKKDAPLVKALMTKVEKSGKKFVWREMGEVVGSVAARSSTGLDSVMADLRVDAPSTVVEVQA